MGKPHFTDKWERSADDHRENWKAWSAGLGGDVRILEIGSYEGRSALLWLELLPTAMVTCVDPFGGTAHGDAYEATFDANTANEPRVLKRKGLSAKVVPDLEPGYSLVYIDGDHSAAAARLDAVMSWPLLHSGGVMIFDDYEWKHGATPDDNPAPGVDAFLREIGGRYTELGRGWQVAIRKR